MCQSASWDCSTVQVSSTIASSSGICIRISFGSLQASYAPWIWRVFTRGVDRQVGLQTLNWASSLKAGSWGSSHNRQGPHVRWELGNGGRKCPHIAGRSFSRASSEQSFQQAGGVGCNRDHPHMGCSQGITLTQKEAWPGNCYRCGKAGHKATKCRFRDAQCHACGMTGQDKSVCRSVQKTLLKSKSAPRPVCMVKEEEEGVEYPLGLYHMAAATNPSPMTVTVSIETFPVTMEINTGATLSLVPEATLTLECVTVLIFLERNSCWW